MRRLLKTRSISFPQNTRISSESKEQTLLCALSSRWPDLFQIRVVNGHATTLLYGDLHLLGNVFLVKKGPAGGARLALNFLPAAN